MADKTTTQSEKTTAQMADEMRLRREQIEMEAAELRLEETREQVMQRKQEKKVAKLRFEQSQEQIRDAIRQRKSRFRQCAHRQGGQGRDMLEGRGPTALKEEIMPDGFTKRIRCLVCRFKISSPLPSNKSTKLKPGETEEQRDIRVAKYWEDLKVFEALEKECHQNNLSKDASSPMHPGTTFTVTDGDGMQIFRPRPSDSYALEI